MTLNIHNFLKEVHYADYRDIDRGFDFFTTCERVGNFVLIPALWVGGGGRSFTYRVDPDTTDFKINAEEVKVYKTRQVPDSITDQIFDVTEERKINLFERIVKFVIGLLFCIPCYIIGCTLKLIAMCDTEIREKHYGKPKPVNVVEENKRHTIHYHPSNYKDL